GLDSGPALGRFRPRGAQQLHTIPSSNSCEHGICHKGSGARKFLCKAKMTGANEKIRAFHAGKTIPPGRFDQSNPAACLSGRFPRSNSYHFNFCSRRATSSAWARLLKALMRKKPSPLEPKPLPGVMTTWASRRILSKASQLVTRRGGCAQR